MWRKIGYIAAAIFPIGIYVCLYLEDRHSAYYGDSIFEHHVLPFDLHIANGWNHELGCMVYSLAYFNDTYTGGEHIVVHSNARTPSQQHLYMQTILSYGYNEKEMIVHWLGRDSVEYYERINSPKWDVISPEQLITKEQINEEKYTWISLIKVIWIRKDCD